MAPGNLRVILDFYIREVLQRTTASSSMQGEYISIDNNSIEAALAAMSTLTLEPPPPEPERTAPPVEEEPEAAPSTPEVVPVHRPAPRPRPIAPRPIAPRTISDATVAPRSDVSSERVVPTPAPAPARRGRSSRRGH